MIGKIVKNSLGRVAMVVALAGAIVTATAIPASAPAEARDRGGVLAGVGLGLIGAGIAGAVLAPRYYAPAPAYVAAAPVYGYPAPVYAAPAPAYYYPPPVYRQPICRDYYDAWGRLLSRRCN